MKKILWLPIILGGLITTVGGVVLIIAICNSAGDLAKTNTYTLKDEQTFNQIDLSIKTSDLNIKASKDGVNKIVCQETTKVYNDVKVKDNVLTINCIDKRNWLGQISFAKHREVTLYLTDTYYEKLTIKGSTGYVEIPKGFAFNDLNISLSTGYVNTYAEAFHEMKIETSTGAINTYDFSQSGNLFFKASTGAISLTNVKANNLNAECSTGDVKLKNTIIKQMIKIRTSTGNVNFEDCDAETLDIETSTGDVTGSLLTRKMFFVATSTGRIDVPNFVSGGLCQVKTSTGDVILTVKG